MKKLSVLLILVSFLVVACGGSGVSVHYRSDVDTSDSRIIAFPLFLCEGSSLSSSYSQYSNPIAEAFFAKGWADALEAGDTIAIPKLAFEKLPKAFEFANLIIGAADTASALERTGLFVEFANTIKNQFGDGAMAFALVFQDKNQYENSGLVNLNLGLFDIKKLTWKWITKTSYEKGLVPMPYEAVVQNLIDESFEALMDRAGSLR